jgi:threonine dehydrogenase-like Zn-dependent dehydrogenase
MQGRLVNMLAPDALEFRQYQVPEPSPGALLVRLVRSHVCGSELHIWCGHHPNKKNGGRGADFCMEVADVSAAFAENIRLVRSGRTVISVGALNPGQTVPCDPGFALRRGVTIIPSMRSFGRQLGKSLRLLAATRERCLVEHA